MRFFRKLLAAPFVALATVIILLEDWLWDDLQRLAAAIGRLPIFKQIEALIVSLPPYACLLTFAAPSLLLIPIKLAALYFIAHQHATLGLLTVIGAKFVGTALVARIYTLTENKLLQIGWFARLHERFVAFKARVYGAIKATRIYQRAQAYKLRVKEYLRRRKQSFLQRRWVAALKLSRKTSR
ncbi:MAG: hypothetical protein HOP19_01195 [Acidobacteria bacterium]|nr:hypothetical protein [Acidobacteriota bacterium]